MGHIPSTTELNIIYWNIGSMKTKEKRSYIQALLANIVPTPDIICLQETHLKESDNFKMPGYVTYISHDNKPTSHGLLTLVSQTIHAARIQSPVPGLYSEIQSLQINLPHKSIQIHNLYKNHNDKLQVFSLFDQITTSSDSCIIMGDFNAHHP